MSRRLAGWSSTLHTVDIPGPCDRNNENVVSTMRVTAIMWIRSSHMDVSQAGRHKDEKAETSETIITEGKRSEWKRRKESGGGEKMGKKEVDEEERTTKQRVVQRARMIYVHEQ